MGADSSGNFTHVDGPAVLPRVVARLSPAARIGRTSIAEQTSDAKMSEVAISSVGLTGKRAGVDCRECKRETKSHQRGLE